MKYCLFFLLPLQTALFYSAYSQISDDFSDGNFANAPVWTGDISNFIVNDDGQLQLSAAAEAGQAYLVTNSDIAVDANWSFYIKMEFNPSSNNYLDVYLISDHEDLSGSLNGYFVRIGNTQHEVSLYRQTGDNSSAVKIIDGLDDRVDAGTVELNIKVTRNFNNQWELLVSPDLSESYMSEGIILDATRIFSKYFGLHCKLSNHSRFLKGLYCNFVVPTTQDLNCSSIQEVV